MKLRSSRWMPVVFAALAAAGLMLPLWPLSALGVALMALWGRWFAALFFGLLLDIVWGAPPGLAHFLYFPFTALAIAAALARLAGATYFISRSPLERL